MSRLSFDYDIKLILMELYGTDCHKVGSYEDELIINIDIILRSFLMGVFGWSRTFNTYTEHAPTKCKLN